MNYVAGFIGAGNMGGILASAAASAVGGDRVIVTCSTQEHTEETAQRLGVRGGTAAETVRSEFIFLGMKPQKLRAIAEELVPLLSDRNIVLVSMLAGVSLETLEGLFGTDKVIRIMPNTPAAAGEGMTLVCCGSGISETELARFQALMKTSGRMDVLPETMFDAASALSGCGPAYMYLFAEALADGAVMCGLPREKAVQYAAQTMLGAAKLMLTSDKHSAALKDAVCSPGGSTITGVYALEQGGVRAAAMTAVARAFEKTRELGKK